MRTIEIILLEIISLLKENKENQWEKTFNFFLYNAAAYGFNNVKKDIRLVYAGMGSFNDLILYNDGKISYDSNIKLDNLRTELFDLVKY